MAHQARQFPLNRTGLLLGILASSAIAVSGAYSHEAWQLTASTTLLFQIIGWGLAATLFFFLLHRILIGGSIALPHIILSSVLLCLPLFLAQPVLSGDLYAYVANAKVSAIGNPYVLTPSSLGGEPILQGVAPAWHNRPSAYGPLWTLVSRGLVLITTDSLALASLFRLLNLVGVLGCAWLISKHSSTSLAALVALNPIILIETIGDGHHDILIGLAMLAAVVTLHKPIRSTLGFATAVAFKYVPLLVAPALIAAAPPARRRSLLAWLLIGTPMLLAFLYAPYWVGIHTLDGVRLQAELFAVPIFFPQALVLIGSFLVNSPVHPEIIARTFGFVGFSIVAIWVVIAAWQQRLNAGAAVVCTLAAYILLAAPYVQTWYLLWCIPLFGLLPMRQAVRWTGTTSIVWTAMLLIKLPT